MMKREYPKQPLAAVGAVIKDDDRVLLIKRRYEPSRGKWSIPGGIVELGETIRDAVKREIEEEVGLKIDVGDIIDVVDNIVYDEKGRVRYHYIITDFLAKPVGGEVKGNAEAIEVRWFNSNELENLNLTNTSRRLLKKIGFLG